MCMNSLQTQNNEKSVLSLNRLRQHAFLHILLSPGFPAE